MKKSIKMVLLLFILLFPHKGESEVNSGSTTAIKYLALGDSYTIGEKVDESDRWPEQLVKKLRDKGIILEHPDIIATTGWTTGELIDGIKNARISDKYQLVSVLIGVNNQYRKLSVEDFRDEYIQILKTAVAFTGKRADRVFAVSIPDWGVTPFARERNTLKIFEEINLFNKVKKEETEKMGIRFFNITDISRKAERDPSLIASDGLHPSKKMYKLWVERISGEIADMIKDDINEH